MVQSGQILQRREIRNLVGLQLQIFQLRAVGERRDILYIQHGENSNLKIRHISRKGDILQLFIVADIEIFHFRAVLQSSRIGDLQIAAYTRHGSKNFLYIGSHGIIAAEPDSPYHFYVREFVADLFHVLVIHVALVHVKIAQVRHAGNNLPHQITVVVHGDVV